MFERFTERARRAIFSARYEASNFGSPHIEPEHLVLGLLREDPALRELLQGGNAVEAIRKRVEAHAGSSKREKIPVSIDLPLSHSCKRALACGAEEADRLKSIHIYCAHLALGILRDEKSFGS